SHYRIFNTQTADCLSSSTRVGEPAAAERCDGRQEQLWLSERRGNAFQLIDRAGLCLEVRKQSRAVGAKIQTNYCDGAANQLWSVDSFRLKDFETLYQADRGSYAWITTPPNSAYPRAVEVDHGRPICRATSFHWLGVVSRGECVGKTYDG